MRNHTDTIRNGIDRFKREFNDKSIADKSADVGVLSCATAFTAAGVAGAFGIAAALGAPTAGPAIASLAVAGAGALTAVSSVGISVAADVLKI